MSSCGILLLLLYIKADTNEIAPLATSTDMSVAR